MQINADQNHVVFMFMPLNAYHCRSMQINSDQFRSIDQSWSALTNTNQHWSELIDIGINARIFICIDWHWALIEGVLFIVYWWPLSYIPTGLWWDCSNGRMFKSLVKMSFRTPGDGLKVIFYFDACNLIHVIPKSQFDGTFPDDYDVNDALKTCHFVIKSFLSIVT